MGAEDCNREAVDDVPDRPLPKSGVASRAIPHRVDASLILGSVGFFPFISRCVTTPVRPPPFHRPSTSTEHSTTRPMNFSTCHRTIRSPRSRASIRVDSRHPRSRWSAGRDPTRSTKSTVTIFVPHGLRSSFPTAQKRASTILPPPEHLTAKLPRAYPSPASPIHRLASHAASDRRCHDPGAWLLRRRSGSAALPDRRRARALRPAQAPVTIDGIATAVPPHRGRRRRGSSPRSPGCGRWLERRVSLFADRELAETQRFLVRPIEEALLPLRPGEQAARYAAEATPLAIAAAERAPVDAGTAIARHRVDRRLVVHRVRVLPGRGRAAESIISGCAATSGGCRS